jgi:chromosome partitioning protein
MSLALATARARPGPPVLAVVGHKGGVGKTTTAVYLAVAFARLREERVLLIDADRQGCAMTWVASVDGWPLNAAACCQPILHRPVGGARALGHGYDRVIVDCPNQDEATMRSALLAADQVVMATGASMMDLDRLRATLALLAEVGVQNEPDWWVLLTRVRARTRLAVAARQWLADLGAPVLATSIGLREVFAQCHGDLPHAGTEYDDVVAELGL